MNRDDALKKIKKDEQTAEQEKRTMIEELAKDLVEGEKDWTGRR